MARKQPPEFSKNTNSPKKNKKSNPPKDKRPKPPMKPHKKPIERM